MAEPPASGERLLSLVRTVALQLEEDLRDAHAASGGWLEPGRTEQLACGALQRALDRLSATGCWGEANRLPSSELWRIAGRWLEVGTLQWRARFKPRGYAGDFEMLDQICTHHVCEHPLGAAFDRFFQSQAAPQAVRNRTALIAEAIARFVRERAASPIHVVSVGSGPAVDLERACADLAESERQRLRITLLDLDPASLDHARLRLSSLLEPQQLRLVRENLFRLTQPGRRNDALGEVDFLICSGLFDYLDEAAAASMLSCFWESLRAAGRALVFNFAPHNPSRAYMEWIGNWYLIYRTEQQLRDLADRAGIPNNCVTVAAEPSGVDLYWELQRPPR